MFTRMLRVNNLRWRLPWTLLQPFLNGNRQRFSRFLAISAVGLGGTAAFSWYSLSQNRVGAASVLLPPDGTGQDDDGQTRSKQSRRFFSPIANVVETVGPAVVTIETNPKGAGDMFFFHNASSAGSGFIVSADGIVVTNSHVVGRNGQVTVALQNGEKRQANVLAIDPSADLAVLQIVGARNMPYLQWADSEDARAGEWVVAMGSPLLFSNTASAGIISAVHRTIPEQALPIESRGINYLQTDAVVIQGNSGGPLINMDAEVVGVNSMMATIGISFAIPSNEAKRFVQFVLKQRSTVGRSSRPLIFRNYIGVQMLSLNERIMYQLRRRYSLPDVKEGVLIFSVVDKSPASKAGLLPGDIVVEVQGKPVRETADIYSAIRENTEMAIVVLRDAKRLTLHLQPATLLE